MKKSFIATLVMVFALGLAGLTIAAVENGKISLKAGDEVYVCGCGEKCPCDGISRKATKCSCDKDMVKGKVSKVEEGKAMIMVNGKERAFKTTGKYACACGPKCDCDTISQKAAKCACGKEMKEVK
ncbi:MAG TPA: hypothetical protein VIU41_07970 [Geobacteraceae bacterium]